MAVIFFRFVGLNISSNPSSTNPDLWTNSKSSFVSSTSSPLSSSSLYVTIVITIVSCVETDLKVNLSCNKEHADYFVKEKNISVVYEWVEPGVDPERGDRPPQNLRKYLFHNEFVQSGKQHSRYKGILPSIVLSQQCCEVYFISLTVVKLLWMDWMSTIVKYKYPPMICLHKNITAAWTTHTIDWLYLVHT